MEPAERILADLQEHPSVKADLVTVFVRCWIAVAEIQLAQPDEARAHLERALETCGRRGFLALLMVQWRLASLRWQTGSVGAALKLHRDPECRALARRFGKWSWLLQSHSSAAKCALDSNRLELVLDELEQVENLIEHLEAPLNSRAIANLCHVRGQYHWRIGEPDEAKRLVREALRLFKESVHVRGTMEANVTLAEFALDTGDYDVLSAQLAGLIRVADRSAYRDLQGRLLAIQTRLAAAGAATDD